ncbi:MAG: CDP-diacylglycerol--glycerol-3-phosphate 3-phosphatidyltransferase [Bdellovibrionota bacterium]
MENWKRNLPLHLTMSRVYVVPLFFIFFQFDTLLSTFAASVLFIVASITDYYDGHYARKWGLVSMEGKFLDPVTDKILVSSVLILLVAKFRIDPYCVIILLARDTIIGGLRSIAAAERVILDAKATGKWKTALQMVAIPCLMLYPLPEPANYINHLGRIILWASVILSLLSGYQYWQIFKARSKNV